MRLTGAASHTAPRVRPKADLRHELHLVISIKQPVIAVPDVIRTSYRNPSCVMHSLPHNSPTRRTVLCMLQGYCTVNRIWKYRREQLLTTLVPLIMGRNVSGSRQTIIKRINRTVRFTQHLGQRGTTPHFPAQALCFQFRIMDLIVITRQVDVLLMVMTILGTTFLVPRTVPRPGKHNRSDNESIMALKAAVRTFWIEILSCSSSCWHTTMCMTKRSHVKPNTGIFAILKRVKDGYTCA